MKLDLLGTKSYHLDQGIKPNAFSDPRHERTLQGIKRDYNKPERRNRTPLTGPYLLRLLSALRTDNHGQIVMRAAFTLAFAALLKVGEFTYRESNSPTAPFSKDFTLQKTVFDYENIKGYHTGNTSWLALRLMPSGMEFDCNDPTIR